jgi:hypothetical protein
MADSHPFLKHLEEHYATENAETRDAHAIRDFVTYTPHERTTIIQQYDGMMSDDDASLRKKAQLMQFRQKLSQTHTALRKAGR